MPNRSLRQRSSGIFAVGAALCLGLASIVAFAADAAAASRISKCTKINKPGSYLLTRNLTTTGSCIVVAADFVTIDLGGWVISGTDTGAGITDERIQRRGITLRNGTVIGFRTGVELARTTDAVVEKMQVSDVETGIALGSSGIVRDSIVDGIGPAALMTGPGSIVRDNIVSSGGDTGILAGFGSIIRDNVIPGADFGIGAGPSSTVIGNNVGAVETAITADSGSTVIGNTSHPQAGAEGAGLGTGLRVDCPSNVIGNTATGAGSNLDLRGDGCTNISNVAP